MNLLFEIADSTLMLIGLILIVIIMISIVVFKKVNDKVKPISDEERYDQEEETIKEVELTDTQKKAKEELERVYNQMSADLAKNPTKEEIDTFEQEQEENAIISYTELMKQANKLKREATLHENDNDYKDNYIEIKEYDIEEPEPEKEEVKEKPVYHGFKNSDIISPIYGIQTEEDLAKRKNNKTIYEKSKEPEDNLNFLNSLKEFRKNL